MAQIREVRVDTISQIKFNKDDTVSLYEKGGQFMLHLPRAALDTIIQLYETILKDLDEKNESVISYWSQPGTEIYSCSKLEETKSEHSGRLSPVRNLCVKQSLDEVIFSKDAFQLLILTAIIILKHKKSNNRNFDLTTAKTIKFNVPDSTFSIFDEQRRVSIVVPIAALARMIANKKRILDDLQSTADDQFFYWLSSDVIVQTVPTRPIRLLLFNNGQSENSDIFIGENAFKKMICIALTGSSVTYEMELFRNEYFDGIPINTVKSIKFSSDNQAFTLIDLMNCVAVNLPVAALDAMLRNEDKILADLQNETFIPSFGRDYINEYWSNEQYNLRTSGFLNSYRGIDCNVVRFSESATNTFKFVIQEKAFREMLDIYRSLV